MSKFACLLTTLALVVLSFPSFAAAQHAQTEASTKQPESLITDRPDFTESSSTVPPMRLQLEAGIQYTYRDTLAGAPPAGHTGRFDSNSVSAPNALLRFGVSDFAELRLGVPNVSYEKITGADSDINFGSLSLGAKFATALSESVRIGAIPYAEVTTEGGDVGGGLIATTAIDLSSKVSVGINAGATTYEDENDERQYEGVGTLALGFTLSQKLGAFAEAYVLVPEGDSDFFVDTGVTYLVTPSVQFDAYLGTQIPDATEIFAGTGVSVLF